MPNNMRNSAGGQRNGSRGGVMSTDSMVCFSEDEMYKIVHSFRSTPEQPEMELPPMASHDRKKIHDICNRLMVDSKSRGNGTNRRVVLRKKTTLTAALAADGDPTLFTEETNNTLNNYMDRFPLRDEEQDVCVLQEDRKRTKAWRGSRWRRNVPPSPNTHTTLYQQRTLLPVHTQKTQILHTILSAPSRVVVVSGDTGCGKTTQIPQFLLEHHQQTHTPCLIMATQPRRLPTISVAERVSAERGERVGDTVGYQIRLEKRVSPQTCLLYCTSGVLLRMLSEQETTLRDVNYIFLDEVHEREQFTDFLLIHLKEQLVPSNAFEVHEYHLAYILRLTGFQKEYATIFSAENNKGLAEVVARYNPRILNRVEGMPMPPSCSWMNLDEPRDQIADWIPPPPPPISSNAQEWKTDNGCISPAGSDWDAELSSKEREREGDADCIQLMDSEEDETDAQWGVWQPKPQPTLSLQKALQNLNVNVEYQREMSTSNPSFATDFGRYAVSSQSVNAANANRRLTEATIMKINHLLDTTNPGLEMTELLEGVPDNELVDNYSSRQPFLSTCTVDVDLLLRLVRYTASLPIEGSILVFLPGYEDIVSVRERIVTEAGLEEGMVDIITLHSQMQDPSAQRRLFQHAPTGVRKIILSTNIAEASITIPDVVIVIDTGFVKEKYHDSHTNISSLRQVRISKSSAIQRKGRAGRCQNGMVFRLYSREVLDSMPDSQIPELLRISIHEACFNARKIISPDRSVMDYLSRAPQPPSQKDLENSVNFLKEIGIFDENEQLTLLGSLVSNLSVAPQHSIMLFYAIMLRCLDPVLSIVSSLCYRDPFMLSGDEEKRKRVEEERLGMAGSTPTFSDHFLLQRAVWMFEMRRERDERDRKGGTREQRNFCFRNGLSYSTMDMILGIKKQIRREMQKIGLVAPEGCAGDYTDLSRSSHHWPVVKAALTAGHYPGIGCINPAKRLKIKTKIDNNSNLHPSCIARVMMSREKISTLPLPYLIFQEITSLDRGISVKTVTPVSALTILLFAGQSQIGYREFNQNRPGDRDKYVVLEIDDNWALKVPAGIGNTLLDFRRKWQFIASRRLEKWDIWPDDAENEIVEALIKILLAEDLCNGLPNPNELRSNYSKFWNAPPRSGTSQSKGESETFSLHSVRSSPAMSAPNGHSFSTRFAPRNGTGDNRFSESIQTHQKSMNSEGMWRPRGRGGGRGMSSANRVDTMDTAKDSYHHHRFNTSPDLFPANKSVGRGRGSGLNTKPYGQPPAPSQEPTKGMSWSELENGAPSQPQQGQPHARSFYNSSRTRERGQSQWRLRRK